MSNLLRRLRYGRPMVVVSGLPRSGTSMMMQMLVAGGMQALNDGIRKQDEDNPRGYFELERIKDLDKGTDKSWLKAGRGKVVKVISSLLKFLPGNLEYKIVFMQRDLDEVLASQEKMLKRRNEADTTDKEEMRASYEKHLKDLDFFFRYRDNFSVIFVRYDKIVANPLEEAKKVNEFLGGILNEQAMASAVEKSLYRNKKDDTKRDAVSGGSC